MQYLYRQVKEFTSRGKLVRELSLRSVIDHPCHAIELSSTMSPVDGRRLIAVVHADPTDSFNRVCAVDPGLGQIQRAYGGPPGPGVGQLDLAVRLAAVDDELVAVADVNNCRVLLLDASTFNCGRELLTAVRPSRLWHDAARHRLYVAVNALAPDGSEFVDGHIAVYDVRKL